MAKTRDLPPPTVEYVLVNPAETDSYQWYELRARPVGPQFKNVKRNLFTAGESQFMSAVAVRDWVLKSDVPTLSAGNYVVDATEVKVGEDGTYTFRTPAGDVVVRSRL